MTSIYKILFAGLLTIILNHYLPAQELSFSFKDYLGTGKSYDLGLDISYSKPLQKNSLILGIELRSIDWGNHLGLVIGYDAGYFQKGDLTIGSITALHPGMALFRPRPFASYGISHLPYFSWQYSKRSFLQLDLGFRYNFSPAYKDYGIYQQYEFPLGIKWGLKF